VIIEKLIGRDIYRWIRRERKVIFDASNPVGV
jgi:hypothetical protein